MHPFVFFIGCVLWFVFFFFKQETAYEMRISDWSSDVCSSDLRQITGFGRLIVERGDIALKLGIRRFAEYDDRDIGLFLEDAALGERRNAARVAHRLVQRLPEDRKSTRLNSSH